MQKSRGKTIKIYDISELLYNGMAVWPGDDPYQFQLTANIGDDCPANIGEVSFSVHTGTHIDAPFHFDQNGKQVHELDLSLYVGPCRVVHLLGRTVVTAEDLQALQLAPTERLLIRTDSWSDRSTFPASFTYLEPEAAAYLQSLDVKLLGVDVPSVDPTNSETLSAHHALHKQHIHILERVVLTQIEPGEYELIALPLPIQQADGSPVRAILRRQ